MLAPAPSRTVLCPGCGYDLRGMTGDRCSECGLVIDRAALRRSGFPWAHRRSVGRVRAFLKTVWLVTADGAALRQEAAKEQSVRDAVAFRRWVAVALSACLLFVAVVLIEAGALRDLVVQPGTAGGGGAWSVVMSRSGGTGWRLAGWQQDLAVPWSAGVVPRPALFVYAVVLAFYVAGAPAAVFRTRDMSADRADTVGAIGRYVAAPLFLVLPAALVLGVALWLIRSAEAITRTVAIVPIIAIVGYALVFFGLAGTAHRTGQWRSRTTDHTWSTSFLAIGELLVRWAIGAAVILFAVPWCVGFVWIALDSLR